MTHAAQRIVLTGGTGLVGGSVLPLLATRHRVTALARRLPASADAHWLSHDLSSPYLPDGLPERVDTVVHLAQSPHFREFPEKARDIFAVNVQSTALLLDWARTAGAQRFVYASSGGIYGYGNQHFREEDQIAPAEPLGYYLASKQCGELLVENYSPHFTVLILRFFFVYGAAQKPEMLVPRLVRSVAEQRPIGLQGDEGIRINPIHVSDAAQAVVECLKLSASEKINVAGPDVLSLRQIGAIIGGHLGTKPRYEQVPSTDPRHLVGDTTKMSRLLGAPQVHFNDGVRELCEAATAPPLRRSGA